MEREDIVVVLETLAFSGFIVWPADADTFIDLVFAEVKSRIR